jgi:predicted Zn-dependent peptidase
MPIEFKTATLPNGPNIIAEVDPSAHSTAIGFFVKTGARDEDASVMGVSHFLEHMMFKGTPNRSAADVDREFDALGAMHNAYTTSELTAFYAHCLPEHLPEAEAILSDILRPALRRQDFDDEKKVVIEEIAMYNDQPFWVLYERAMEEYYGDHTLSHRVLGTTETVGEMSRDAMQSYFDHRYSADNTVVAMAGRLDFDAMVNRLASHCGSWSATNAVRSHVPVAFSAKDFTIESATAHQNYLIMLCPGPPLADDARYAASMLMQILGDSEGSRLYWALIETGLADEAQAQYHGRDGVGEMIVYCASSGSNAHAVESIIRKEMDDLAASITDDDLARVRSKIATSATLQGELPAGRMRRLGQVWTSLGQYRSLESELERINAVTIEDVRAVAAAYPLDEMVVGRLVPGGDGESDQATKRPSD